jgi:hypothetical protein
LLISLFFSSAVAAAQQLGGIRVVVFDKDFNAPLPGAQILIVETGEKVAASDEGSFFFAQVAPGRYTLVFSKEGYTRQVMGDIVVTPGAMTELNASLAGDFAEMEEFIVQDVQLGPGTEAALLELRMASPALLDSIGADLIGRAGAGDAASALNLVAGASVQEGKYAVIRGLPDRYVNSQMNGVRLPTADADRRAVELDQFPAAVIDSIQVSKTFTPDQQGDASGGAVNVVLKGIPDEPMFKFSLGSGYNTQVTGRNDFLTYNGGGVNYWGVDDARNIPTGRIGGNWNGAVGVTRAEAPVDYKWSLAAGGKYRFGNGIKIGGLGSFFYERDSSLIDDGIDDKYWVEKPGAPMTPQFSQGTPSQGDFKTSLFDVTKGSEEVRWGGLGVVGLETENHSLALSYLYTRVAEDVATLAEDTRGKAYFFPDYKRDDPKDPGNLERDAAPYLRTETLQYTERVTQTLQLTGRHRLPFPEWGRDDVALLLQPQLDWSISHSLASLDQPDKRQFGELWWADSFVRGFPPYVPPSISPQTHRPFKPAANFTLGNLQRIWKDISEESDQYAMNMKFPFRQWSGDEGYLKVGVFRDEVHREYNQDSFSNFNDNSAHFEGPFETLWSDRFPSENHPVTAADIDVDYQGEQDISAWYYMGDLPLSSYFRIVGGGRYERTELSIVNNAEKDVTWIPPGAAGPVALNAGEADVSFAQDDLLPSIGFALTPLTPITLRGSYSRTVARQTFKELTPIQQQEFLGGDVFIGNPGLQMSALENYDLRVDYRPYGSGLVSFSYFHKDIANPIEYVQRIVTFPYTTAVNYPEGELSGYEIELRQELAHVWDVFDGLTLGANATFIDSQVTLPADEAAQFDQPNIDAPMPSRDMTNAPEHLYNLFLTYDLDTVGLSDTQVALFYTVKGDTLVAGAGQSQGNFIPNIYETEYATLNVSLNRKLGEHCNVTFQAKNLLNPKIDTVYRSEYIGDDVAKTSYRKGMEFTIGFNYEF